MHAYYLKTTQMIVDLKILCTFWRMRRGRKRATKERVRG
jgi:hypothetical protein